MTKLGDSCPAFVRQGIQRLADSPVGSRLAKGVFWNLAGTAISRGLAVVSSICVARFLGRESFGQLGIIQSTVGMFGVVAGLGLGLTATKYIAEYRMSDPARAGRIMSNSFALALGSGALLTVGLLVMSPWLARRILAESALTGLLRSGSLLVLMGALNAVQTGALSGLESFKAIARANLWSGFLSFPCLLAGAYLAGAAGAVWGLVAGMAVNATLNHHALLKEAHRLGIRFSYRLKGEDTRVLWHFSAPSLLSSLLGWGTTWGCAAMLVNTAGGYGEMGIVNATNQWRAALMFIPGLLTSTLLPVLSNERGGSSENYRKALRYSHGFITFLLAPLAAVLMLAAKPVLACYGEGFADGRLALVFVLAGTAISAISSPIGCVIIANGRMWASLSFGLLNALTYATCTWALADSGGATGLALGYLAGNTAQSVSGIGYMKPLLPDNIALRNLCGIAVVLVLTAILTFVL